MSTNEEDNNKDPMDEVDPKAKAALMIIMAALKKSTEDSKQYLALIIRKAIEGKDKQKEAEDVMQTAEVMLDAAMKLHRGRGHVAIAALCLADIIVTDLFNDLFPELKLKEKGY